MTTELDRLLTPEPLGPQHNPSEVGSMIAAVANSARDARNQLRESVRPEVEALQARVRDTWIYRGGHAEKCAAFGRNPSNNIPCSNGCEAHEFWAWFRAFGATLEGKD